MPLVLISCSEETNEKKSEKAAEKKEVAADIDSSATETKEAAPKADRVVADKKDYYGSFFKISYPQDFKSSPDGPKDTYPESDMEYIETDEAVFTSQDGVVQFYVFSPQWGGTSKWESALENEKLVSSKTTEQEQEIGGMSTITYMTFEAKDGSYTRSISIKETENTKMAFGVKYPDIETYRLFKPEYLEFKKSLEQFAD